jgi:hypothetical protein
MVEVRLVEAAGLSPHRRSCRWMPLSPRIQKSARELGQRSRREMKAGHVARAGLLRSSPIPRPVSDEPGVSRGDKLEDLRPVTGRAEHLQYARRHTTRAVS